MSSPKTILIIGATQGIGLEFVRQTSAQNPSATIYTTARSLAKATELQALADSSSGHIKILIADVTDNTSLQLAAKEIETKTSSLDLVIYNSGVLAGWGSVLDPAVDAFKQNIETNVYGAYYATHHFAPLLLKSTFKHKALVFLSSTYGSITLADDVYANHARLLSTPYDPAALYNISKSALNRLGKEIDQVLRPQGLPIVLIHPGLIKTNMNPFGTMPVDESVSKMLKVIGAASTEAKLFVDYDGNELPW